MAMPRLARMCMQYNARQITTSALHRRTFDDFRNILADAPRPAVEVKSLSEKEGFRFVDGLIVPSACIFVGANLFMWNVPAAPTNLKWTGWSENHFKLFEIMSPKPEILLIGTGKRVVPVAPHLKKYLNNLGIQVDVFDSWNACSTFNLLAEEGRRVAVAVCPLRQADSNVNQEPS